MAQDLVTRLSLQDQNFTSGIASATSSLQKMDKQAVLTKRGLSDFFNSADSTDMINSFESVGRVLKNLEKKMGAAGTGMKQQMKAMSVAAAELEQEYRNLSSAEKQSAAGQSLRQHIDELIAKSGELKDTFTDVQGAIKFASSDTAQLDALAQGITTLSATAQVAAGAMSLFGVSEEKVAQVQKSLVAIMAVTNGLKTIQNALQKESNLMQFIAIAREKGLAVALGLRTAATVAATTAEEAETVAVEANTAAWAMNPIGLVIVAVAALTAGIIALTNALLADTEAEKGEAEAMKAVNEAMAAGYKKYKETEIELGQLKTKLEKFNGTKKDEKELVDELNKKYGDTLGKYKDLDSWMRALSSTSLYYCRVLQMQARVTALNAVAAEAWANAMAGEDYEKNMAKYNALQKPIEDALDDLMFYQEQLRIARKLAGDISDKESGSGSSRSGKTKTEKTSSGEKKTEREKLSADISDLQKQLDSIDKQKYPEKAAEVVSKIIAKYRESMKFLDTSTKEGADEQIKTLEKMRSYYKVSSDDYKKMTAEIEKAQEQAYIAAGGQIGDLGWDKQKLRNEIKNLKDEIEHSTNPIAKATLQIELEDKEAALKKLESDIDAGLPEVIKLGKHKRNITFDYKLTDLEKLQKDFEVTERAYDDLYNKFKKNEISFDEFEKAGDNLEAFRNKLKFAEITEDIKNYKKELTGLYEDGIKNGISGLRSLYDAFKKLSDPMEGAENAFEGFLNVMDSLVSIYDTVKGIIDIITQITAVIKQLTAAKEAEKTIQKQETNETEKSIVSSLTNIGVKKAEQKATQGNAAAKVQEAAGETLSENAGTGPWGWIIGIAAAVAVLAMLGTILGAFAEGGIVGGHNNHGDQIYARLNSGEMVLNRKQQANLFRLLDSGSAVGTSGNVEFKIRGQELVGVMKNFNDKHNKLK